MALETIKGKGSREAAPWRPFLGPTRMEQGIERLFNELIGRPFDWPTRLRREDTLQVPAIEVVEEKDEVVVKAEIPGIKKENLEVNLSDNLLTIRGEKKEEEEVKKKGYYYSERSFGSFSRTIEIPVGVHADKARANFKDGVLEVRLPKTEEAKRKEVKLKVE